MRPMKKSALSRFYYLLIFLHTSFDTLMESEWRSKFNDKSYIIVYETKTPKDQNELVKALNLIPFPYSS